MVDNQDDQLPDDTTLTEDEDGIISEDDEDGTVVDGDDYDEDEDDM